MLNSIYQLELAVADGLRGRLADAERGFAASIAGWRAAGQRGLAAAVCNLLGHAQLAQGRLNAVLATYQMALEITAPPGQPALPAAGIAYAGMAEVEYQRGELEAALRHVTEALTLGCRHGYVRVFADEGAPMRALLAQLPVPGPGDLTRAPASTPATWPRWCAPAARQTPRRRRGEPPPRRRAWPSR